MCDLHMGAKTAFCAKGEILSIFQARHAEYSTLVRLKNMFNGPFWRAACKMNCFRTGMIIIEMVDLCIW